MFRVLFLSILLFESVAAQEALDEGQKHPWTQTIDECIAAGGLRSECWKNATSFEMEVGEGVLKVHSFSAPIDVDENRLRNLTNVDRSTPLTLQDWGRFTGYQHDYSERGSFFRQWWLVSGQTMLFVVYESRVEATVAESEVIDGMLRSMTAGEEP